MFAYALLYREALRSLKPYPAGDVVRDKLAAIGFAVRDAEQLLGKERGYFVRRDCRSRLGVTFQLMQQFAANQLDISGVLRWMYRDSDDAGILQHPRASESNAYAETRLESPFARPPPPPTRYADRAREDLAGGPGGTSMSSGLGRQRGPGRYTVVCREQPPDCRSRCRW